MPNAAANSRGWPASIRPRSRRSKAWESHDVGARPAHARARLGPADTRFSLDARRPDRAAICDWRISPARHALALLVRLRHARADPVSRIVGLRGLANQ